MGTEANRITSFLDDSKSTTLTRSPAQQAASRLNGSRSRGPVTPEGKSRSRLNAMRHGLLARVISPPADLRGQDRLYRQIRAELIAELRPTTFTENARIDALASDYVQLARVRGMIESLQHAPSLSSDDAKKFEELARVRRDLKAIEYVYSICQSGAEFNCNAVQARRVIARLVDLIHQLKQSLDIEGEDAVPEEELSDFEREELRQLKTQWAVVQPLQDRLSDQAKFSAALCGQGHLGKKYRQRLAMVLSPIIHSLQEWIARQRDLTQRVRRAQRQALEVQANAPERLILLHRYQSKLERAIEKKIRTFTP